LSTALQACKSVAEAREIAVFINNPAYVKALGRRAGVIAAAMTLAAVSAAGASAADQARAQRERSEVTVSYKDLDLATPAGAKIMQGRLEAAAEQACGDRAQVSSDPIAVSSAYRACVEGSVADAAARLGAPEVTALVRRTSASSPKPGSHDLASASAR
jgi:UrcA family protein